MSDEIELPATIAAAWGVREQPGKGPKPGLSVQRIVQAAIATAQDEGLAAVSMNRVASRLGTAAMSLYRYVTSKDELIALMVDEAQGTPPDLPGSGEDWRAGLAHWARANLDVYRARPWLVDIPIRGAPILPNGVAWFEQGLRCLAGTGFTEDEKIGVILLVSGLVRNQATLEVQLEAAMPALHAAIAAGAFDEGDGEGQGDDDLWFDFSLDRVLDGMAAFLRERGQDV